MMIKEAGRGERQYGIEKCQLMVRARIPAGFHRCSGQACSDGRWVDEAGAAVVDRTGQ